MENISNRAPDRYKLQIAASSPANNDPVFTTTTPTAALDVVALGAAVVVADGVELSLTPDGELD